MLSVIEVDLRERSALRGDDQPLRGKTVRSQAVSMDDNEATPSSEYTGGMFESCKHPYFSIWSGDRICRHL